MPVHTIVVGNIGTVYEGESDRDARLTFNIYIDHSQSNRGRCAGEDVTWLRDGDIVSEFIGTLHQT